VDDVLAGVVLALDLGGTRIRAAEVDARGSVRRRLSVPTPVAEGPDAIVSACVDLVRRVRAAAGPERRTGDRLLGPARNAVARLAFRAPARRVRIVPAELGDDVGLVGASVLVRARLAAPGASVAPDRAVASGTAAGLGTAAGPGTHASTAGATR
jgi:glucokinase